MAQNQSKTTSQRILSLIALEKEDISIVIVLTVGIGFLSLVSPIAVQMLVNIVTLGGVAQPLIMLSFILFILLCLSGAIYVLEYYVVEHIQRRVFVRVARETSQTASQMPIIVYDNQNSVELMNRFFDVSTIQKATYILLTNGLMAVMQLVIGSIVLLFYSFYFAVIVFAILAISAFIVYILGHHAAKYAIAESYAKYDMVAWLQTIAKNFHIFKFSHGHQLAKNKTEQLISHYLHNRHQHFNLLLKQNILAVIAYACAGTLMMAFGGLLVMRGEINLGQFVAAEFIIFGVLSAFISFVKKLETYYDMMAAVDKIGGIEDLQKENFKTHLITLTHPINLTFNNVSYAYIPSRPVINNLSFSIQNGQSVAFYGADSSGKSTICDLICALRQPTSGNILINNVDLRLVNFKSLREQIGLATDPEVLQESILENIRLFDESIPIYEIQAVLTGLNIEKEISFLPDGQDTLLSANGSPLTLTFIRLLMIARALINKPSFIVIDGLLDELSDSAIADVLRFIKNYNAESTLVVLTNNETVARNCQQVIKLAELNDKESS